MGRRGYLNGEGEDSLKNFFVFARNVVTSNETEAVQRSSVYKKRKSLAVGKFKVANNNNTTRRISTDEKKDPLSLPPLQIDSKKTAIKEETEEQLASAIEAVQTPEKPESLEDSLEDCLDGSSPADVRHKNIALPLSPADLAGEILVRRAPTVKTLRQIPGFKQVMNVTDYDSEDQKLLKLLKVEYLVKLQKSQILNERCQSFERDFKDLKKKLDNLYQTTNVKTTNLLDETEILSRAIKSFKKKTKLMIKGQKKKEQDYMDALAVELGAKKRELESRQTTLDGVNLEIQLIKEFQKDPEMLCRQIKELDRLARLEERSKMHYTEKIHQIHETEVDTMKRSVQEEMIQVADKANKRFGSLIEGHIARLTSRNRILKKELELRTRQDQELQITIKSLQETVNEALDDLTRFHDIRRNVLYPSKKCSPDDPIILSESGNIENRDFWKIAENCRDL